MNNANAEMLWQLDAQVIGRSFTGMKCLATAEAIATQVEALIPGAPH